MKKIFLILLLSLVLTLVLSPKQFENYPEVKLVHGKLGPNMQNWTYRNGVERYSGRVIYWAKIINKNGFIPLDKWKWDKYIGLYEKNTNGVTLSDYENGFYNGFPDSGETHLECYQNALMAMSWIMKCTAQHNIVEIGVMRSTDIVKIINSIIPNYPRWIL